MNESQIAKNLLANDNMLQATKVDVKGYDLIKGGRFYSYDIPTDHLRFKISFITNENAQELFEYLNKHNGAYFFTQWHIDNQDLERRAKNTGIWDGNVIYTNEMIRFECNYDDIKKDEETILPNNPFELDMQHYISQTKIRSITFDGIVTLTQPVAETILPNLNTAYIVVAEINR